MNRIVLKSDPKYKSLKRLKSCLKGWGWVIVLYFKFIANSIDLNAKQILSLSVVVPASTS